jgi:hypothetical protein
MHPTLVRSVVAEFVGTFLLVLLAVGSAVAGFETVGPLGVALAFGLVLLGLAYALGPVSGCHVNPAVTLGVLLSRGMTLAEAGAYWAAQFAGGIVGASVLWLLTSGFGDVTDQTGALGANDYGATISLGGAFLLEVLLTFAFVGGTLLRRSGDRPRTRCRPPRRHPADRDLGEPGALVGTGAVHRRRAAGPRVALPPGPPGRCCPRGVRRTGARALRGPRPVGRVAGGHRRPDGRGAARGQRRGADPRTGESTRSRGPPPPADLTAAPPGDADAAGRCTRSPSGAR